MPKLYHNGAHWQVPGQQDKTAARVDVPASPADLAAWLEARRVTAEPNQLVPIEHMTSTTLGPALEDVAEDAAALTPRRPSDRCDVCKSRLLATAAGADKAAVSRELQAISEWCSTAPTWALQRLAELITEEAAATQAGTRQ